LKQQKFYRLNQYISAPTLRVLNEEGKQIGILTREEALKKAQEEKLDLVEIAPQAKPPVAKIIDFKKFRYLEEKKEKKGQKTQKTKEVKMRPFIGENDFNFRLKRAQEWLKEGQNVRVTVNFRGREFTQKEAGFALLEKFSQGVSSFGQPKDKPKMMGPNLFILLEPLKR
jgi:translation initiation factor IF-3